MSAGWQLGPFTRHDGAIVRDLPTLTFACPVLGADVEWAAKDVFNPAAVVHDGRVHLLIRGEDAVGRFSGTSRIGLATSEDGALKKLRNTFDLITQDQILEIANQVKK